MGSWLLITLDETEEIKELALHGTGDPRAGGGTVGRGRIPHSASEGTPFLGWFHSAHPFGAREFFQCHLEKALNET